MLHFEKHFIFRIIQTFQRRKEREILSDLEKGLKKLEMITIMIMTIIWIQMGIQSGREVAEGEKCQIFSGLEENKCLWF